MTIEAIPDRSSALHFNVVRLLEVKPCTSCLRIENIRWLAGNIVQADFRLQHPFPGLIKFTGFDVRGIFISEADYLFPETDRRFAHGMNVPRLLNPDGYTSLFNPTEFPEGSAPYPILAYITGKYSTGGDLSSTLNPYVAYSVDQPRRIFRAGTAETQTVQVYYPSQPIEFGYAVDASWFPAENVVDPVTDFPPEANCMEAYKIAVHGGEPVELSSGASIEVHLEIYDRQGLETISSVTVEAPDIFEGAVDFHYSRQNGPDSWLFSGWINSACGLADGTYPVLVRVEDTVVDPNLGRIYAWQVFEVEVTDYFPGGWVRTWGLASYDHLLEMTFGLAVASDGFGNIYAAGTFFEDVNLDRLCGDVHWTRGEYDVFLIKLDSSGNHIWGRSWGGEDDDHVAAIAADSAGNVYVTGWFYGTVFFDPVSGDAHTSNGELDVYLTKFDSSGNFEWARTWGGTERDQSCGIAVDDLGCVYVIGDYSETVDFNPDGGDPHSSNGWMDVFLGKFDSSGNFIWVETWGGPLFDHGCGVGLEGLDGVYISGYSQYHNPQSHLRSDGFLGKLDPSGNSIWLRTWGGGEGSVYPHGVAVGNARNVYVTGDFSRDVDFDPYEGDVRNYRSDGSIFLTRYDFRGNYRWTRTWGGWYETTAWGIAADYSGNIYVAGQYTGTCDFNPSGGDPHTSYGHEDAFLSKFSPLGHFRWARTWGGSVPSTEPSFNDQTDDARAVTVDTAGNAYAAGTFIGPSIFSPSDPPCNEDPDIRPSIGFANAYLVKYLPDGCW